MFILFVYDRSPLALLLAFNQEYEQISDEHKMIVECKKMHTIDNIQTHSMLAAA